MNLPDCIYCERTIDINADGWGYFIEIIMFTWHTECLEITEGVRV